MSATSAAAASPSTPPLLRVRGLSATVGPVSTLAGIDLEISPGEIVALTGEPGAGKTALIRCIAGDVTPADGTVTIGGEQVRIEPGAAQRQGIAVVWQSAELCDNLDVASNILLGRETAGLLMSESRFHATAVAILEGLRIPIRDTTRLAGSLASGERQLLAIAAAISREPRLILFDEPTAPLGAVEAAHVEALIEALRQRGAAVVVASRETDQMFRIADRIIVLRHGRRGRRARPGADPSRRRRGARLRPAGRLNRAPPADATARPRRQPRLGRPLLEPVADPVRARRGARGRARLHPRASKAVHLRGVARLQPRGDRARFERRSRGRRHGRRTSDRVARMRRRSSRAPGRCPSPASPR